MERQKRYNRCSKDCACAECKQNGLCSAWVSFVDKHGAQKGYAHFDRRVSLEMDSVRDYVMNRAKVAAHGFYPFIHFEKKNSRYGRKGPKKPRELYYCFRMDRCIYQRYAFLLNYLYNIRAKEEGIDRVATAYRNNLGKNNIDFAKEVLDAIRGMGKCLVVVGDFTDFFNKLEHRYLKERLCGLLGVERLPEDYFAVFQPPQDRINAEVEALVIDAWQSPVFLETIQNRLNQTIDEGEIKARIDEQEKAKSQLVGAKEKQAQQMDKLDINTPHYDDKYEDMQRRLDAFYDDIAAIDANIQTEQCRLVKVFEGRASMENALQMLRLVQDKFLSLPDATKKQVFQEMLESVEIFEQRQPDGRQVKAIHFRFPVTIEGETSKDWWYSETQDEPVCLLSKHNLEHHN